MKSFMFVLCTLAVLATAYGAPGSESQPQNYPATVSPSPPSPNLCVCPFNYNPVCGSDQQTYGNACALRCENSRRRADELLTKLHDGECKN